MRLVDIFPNGMSLSERRGRGKDYVAGMGVMGALLPGLKPAIILG
jgi:hypothetical protein